MRLDYLEFERPIAEIQDKIDEMRRIGSSQSVHVSEEIYRLEQKREAVTQTIFASLSAHQVVQVARHPLRPYTQDYIQRIFTDFDELCGDRHQAQGAPIISGLARLEGEPVVVIGHQKGRNTTEKVKRNFGMATPEAFRKALRIMKMAEKFNLPILTFIDTPGAYPGIGAEERNQSEAIARNLFEMAQLKTPIICTVIGEGCSGGALAIGVGDRVLMLQYSYYSVISPEGCASILWKKSDKAPEAAEALGLTSACLFEQGLIDEIVREPLGGAHRNVEVMADTIKEHLLSNLALLKNVPLKNLLDQRYQRLTDVGRE